MNSVLYLNTMKLKLLFLISFLATMANTGFTKEIEKGVEDSTKQGNMVVRSEQQSEFNRVYFQMPSLLSVYENPDFAYILVGSRISGGEFKNLQLHDRNNFLELKTESILTLPAKKWRFYGEFCYRNGYSRGGEWNLSYNPSDIGSPYYFMQEKEGEWDFQTYTFRAVAAKTLPNDKVSLGIGISYNGILDFRKVDTRNESYRLGLLINPSITVELGSRHSVSAGLLFGRNKFEPEIYNKYQHGGETELYQIFFNQGLGTWDSNPSLITMLDNQQGGSISWGISANDYRVNVIYQLVKGLEDWKLNSYSNQSTTSSNYSKYEYIVNSLTANFRNHLPNGSVYAEITAKYYNGEGSPYNTGAARHLKNFTSSTGIANIALSYLPLGGYLKRGGIGSVLYSQRQKDLNYDHTTSYANQRTTAWADFMFGNVNKMGLLVSLSGGYQSNISNLHTPKAAASNFYNTKIAIPSLAYLTSDYYITGVKLGSEFDLTKEYRLEVILNGEILKPTKINYGNASAKYSLSDDFYNLNLSLLFNF